MNDAPGIITPVKDPNAPMTQAECEDYILLKSQSGERWFEVQIMDEKVREDPTMKALMKAISDTIFAGMVTVGMEERMAQAEEDCKGVMN